MDQSRIGEVHGPVPITLHQGFEVGEILGADGKEDHAAGAQEIPARAELKRTLQEMKELGEERRGCAERQREGVEGFDAGPMPAVATVEESKQPSGIDETARPTGEVAGVVHVA